VTASRSPDAWTEFRAEPADTGVPSLSVAEFLLATRNDRVDSELQRSIAWSTTTAGTEAARRAATPTAGAPGIALPVEPLAGQVADVLQERRSRRDFTGQPLRLAVLAAIIRQATGITGGGAAPSRATPSAGGLYPVQTWLAAFDVDGLDRGIYRYHPVEDQLSRWRDGDGADAFLTGCVWHAHGIDLAKVPALLLFVVAPARATVKYGPRGLRFAYHEVGALAQNTHLLVTSAGLGSIDFTGFYDDEAHTVLGFDGIEVSLAHTVAIGPVSTGHSQGEPT